MCRRGLALVACLVLLVAPTACTPEGRGQVAVRKVDGGAELVFATCANDPIVYVSLYDDRDNFPDKGWRLTAGPGAVAVDAMRLFAAPAGWQVELDSLERLEAGVKYGVRATSKNGLMSELIGFTVEQIDGLTDGDVNARKSMVKSQVLSMTDFQEAAVHDCP